MTTVPRTGPARVMADDLRPAFGAARVQLGLVLGMFGLAGLGWWWTAGRMQGMDAGPWSTLGGFGWFVGVWVVMMTAMMLPSVAPTVALYARMTSARSPLSPVAFITGYLLTWTVAGVAAYALTAGADRLGGGTLAWDRAGQPLAGATLVVAAAYEVTPLKNVCLGKCRSPLGFLLGSWRDGWRGGVRMGARHGGWCVGCCWALMASLFALGIMSLTWMAVVAGLIAMEKTLPWRRWGTFGTAGVLLVLGVLMLAAPHALPGLTLPGGGSMPMMSAGP